MKKLSLFCLVVTLLVVPHIVHAALRVEQSTTVPTSGAGSGVILGVDTSVTLNSATSNGNLLVVVITLWDNSDAGTVAQVYDNKSNTFTQVFQNDGSSTNARIATFYAQNINGGSSHQVTVDVTGNIYGSFTVVEVSGAARFNVLDTGATATSEATPNSTVSTVTSGTLAQANEIIFGQSTIDGAGSNLVNPASPWNALYLRDDYGSDHIGGAVYQIVTSRTAVTATWTHTDSTYARNSGVAAFKASSGSAIVKPANNLGLVGYWPMNEATSTLAGDFSGNGYTGTLSGSTIPTWVTGKLGKALSFDGSTGFVQTTFNQTLLPATITAWVKVAASDLEGCDGLVFSRGTDTSGINIGGCNASTNIAYHWNGDVNTYNWQGGPTVPTDVWFLVALVVESSQATVYACSAGTCSSGVNAIAHSSSVIDDLKFGQDDNGSRFFKGQMDDVRVYSRALTAAQVLALYNQGAARVVASTKTLQQGSTLTSGLVGLWTFDGGDTNWTGGSTGVAYDGSGNNNIGTLTNMSRTDSIVIGKLGQAFTFDGSTQYINAGTGSSLNLSSTGSLAAWVKYTASCGSFAEIFGQYNNNNDTNGYEIACYPSNGLSLVIANATTPNIVSSAGAYNDGTWHHVAGTWDGSNLRLFVDGSLIAGPSAQTVNAVSNVNNFNIARDSANGNAYFPGIIDDVRVYSRALSAAEVKQLYLLGRTLVKP